MCCLYTRGFHLCLILCVWLFLWLSGYSYDFTLPHPIILGLAFLPNFILFSYRRVWLLIKATIWHSHSVKDDYSTPSMCVHLCICCWEMWWLSTKVNVLTQDTLNLPDTCPESSINRHLGEDALYSRYPLTMVLFLTFAISLCKAWRPPIVRSYLAFCSVLSVADQVLGMQWLLN